MYDDDLPTGELPAYVAGAGGGGVAVDRPTFVLPETATEKLESAFSTIRRHFARLLRYAVTSGVSLGISEAVLLILYSTRTLNATVAAIVANLAGTVPSYFLSRYWIWSDADRKRVGRQVVLYWAVSIVAMTITSLATGAITSIAPAGHRAHVLVAGMGFLGINVVLWVTKYVLYQKVIFPNGRAALAANR